MSTLGKLVRWVKRWRGRAGRVAPQVAPEPINDPALPLDHEFGPPSRL